MNYIACSYIKNENGTGKHYMGHFYMKSKHSQVVFNSSGLTNLKMNSKGKMISFSFERQNSKSDEGYYNLIPKNTNYILTSYGIGGNLNLVLFLKIKEKMVNITQI
jgi:hypothetical protein